MDEPHVSLDAATLSPVERKLQGPLEDQLSSALQAATEEIRDRYAGEPVDEVLRRLAEGTRARLHPDIAAASTPDYGPLRQVAQAIVEGR